MKDEHFGGILDTISYSQQNETLRTFDPQNAVLEHMRQLADREKQVLVGRYGLTDDGHALTLEQIGQKLGLTRERIRQIEKDGLKKLRLQKGPENLQKGIDLIFQIIIDRGHIARQDQILSSVLAANNSPVARQCVLFMIHLSPQFRQLKETEKYHQSWYLPGFDEDLLERLAVHAGQILSESQKPLPAPELVNLLKSTGLSELEGFSSDAVESYLAVSKQFGKNPYGEIGLAMWSQVRPKDVGDKAYLILSHLGKPEHYSKITDLINKQGFDGRTAHKESVHNELIKDKRFVLVGRGIYALAEWGFKSGVVADIITEVISKAGQPLSRDQIIAEVLKQRVVKRNTIIVGLSNKNKFRKTADHKFLNVQ